MESKELYTPEEVANLLGYNVQTIYARCRDGSIKARQLIKGGLWKIPANELARLRGITEIKLETENKLDEAKQALLRG
jgi:excisionase family DNA binding protein